MSAKTPCPFCKEFLGESYTARATHVSACVHAPEEAREEGRRALAHAKELREAVVCCRLRKKIELTIRSRSEDLCGIPDTELADVMTFGLSPNGRDVIAFRFCPWCGAKWIPTGMITEPPKDPREDEGHG